MYTYHLYNSSYLFAYTANNFYPHENGTVFSVRCSLMDTSKYGVKTITRYNVENSDFFNNTFNEVLPMAVRYYDSSPLGKYYLIERPPFKANIDYSRSKSYQARRPHSSIQGKEIWLPWTCVGIYIPSTASQYGDMRVSLFFNDSSLSSPDDILMNSYFPNCSSSSANVCLGSTLSRVPYDQDNTPISQVVNDIYNDYFSGGWNNDISSVLYYNEACLPAIKRIKDLNPRKYTSFYSTIENSLLNDNETFKFYRTHTDSHLEFLYCYSQMTFEEVMQYHEINKKAYLNFINNRSMASYGFDRYRFTNFSDLIKSIATNFSVTHRYESSPVLDMPMHDRTSQLTLSDQLNCYYSSEPEKSAYYSLNVVISDLNAQENDIYEYFSHPMIIADVFKFMFDYLRWPSLVENYNFTKDYSVFNPYEVNQLQSYKESINA